MKKFLRILALVLFLAGLIVYFMPSIYQQMYDKEAQEVITGYQERMEAYEKDDLEWLYQLIVRYNKELYENKQSDLNDPFDYEQADLSLKQFGFNEEIIGSITIPKMDIELPIYLGASADNLNKGAAQLTKTSIPVGGNNTNAVIAAHRGYGKAAMFRHIEKLETGDEVYITNFRETLRYRVAETKIILPTDIQEVLIQSEKDMVTLITCHPYRKNYQRYVVYCERD